MKLTTSLLFITALLAPVSPLWGAGLAQRPLTGELIDATCFVKTNGSVGSEYHSCIEHSEKAKKSITFALLTPEGDVYLLVPEKGQTFEDLRLGEQVQIRGIRTIVVGKMKKMK